MIAFEQLEIYGFLDRTVPHTFLRQEAETDHLALLFPGRGYRATMPLLYYTELLLADQGADVLRLETAYDRIPEFDGLAWGERWAWLTADAEAACEVALAQRPYQRVTLVGKSLGTLIMGHLLVLVPQLATAECIWLTPLVQHDQLRAQIEQAKPRSFFAAGTADRFHDPKLLAELEYVTGGQSVIIEGGVHSLLIPGDVLGSIDALEWIMEGTERFIKECR